MIDFIKENWVVITISFIYLIQIIKVLNWQHNNLTRQNCGTPMPMWKLCLFLLPGMPIVWGFCDLFLFDSFIKIFVMTRKNDIARKQNSMNKDQK